MRKKTNEEFIQEVYELTNGEYTPLESYEGSKIPIKMRHNCSVCNNHDWPVKPNHFLSDNERCPICSINKRNANLTKPHQTFINEVYQLCDNEFSVLSIYRGNKKKIDIRHNSPACNFYVAHPLPNNFLRKPSCPICSHASTSFAEQYIYLILKAIIPETENSVKIRNRECDIYIPNMKIGIQYDGQYYHKDPAKDNSFNNLFFESGGTLLFRIRENECPALIERDNLIILNLNYKVIKPKMLIRICRQIIRKINSIMKTHYPFPCDSELIPLIKEANKSVINSEKYQKLFEELVTFYKEYHRFPKRVRKNQNCYENKLAERVYYAKKRKIFSESLLASVALS